MQSGNTFRKMNNTCKNYMYTQEQQTTGTLTLDSITLHNQTKP